ncbi:MFS transporter [Tistrella bauzanensis]|uniref:MFS transporter n=1 Tax=Tistrella arctica TaxID=3133430 RepID=A0ABU9YFP6_9PROT
MASAAGRAATTTTPPVRVLTVIGGIYVTQSIIGGLTFHGLPTVLRAAGAGYEVIGLVSLLMLPWALKFLWAPWIERLRRPVGGGRRTRVMVLAGQGIAIVTIATLAASAGLPPPAMVLAVLAWAALVTATVDIGCDAYAVEQLPPALRGLGNVMQVGGGYVGALIGGGVFLVLVDRAGWSLAILALVVVMAALTLPMALTREGPPAIATVGTDPAHRPSLARAFARRPVLIGLVVVLLMQAGLRLAMGLTGPMLIDRGVSLQVIGLISGAGGMAASLVGTLLAGLALRRVAPERLLAPLVAGEGLLLGLLAVAIMGDVAARPVLGLTVVLSLVQGAAFVALYSAMMGWSASPQAGVDFTLLQCADAGIAALAGLSGGLIAAAIGLDVSLALAAATSLVAAGLIPALIARMRRPEGMPA